MKRCSGCRRRLPFEKFDKNKSTKDGYNNQCKECRHELYLKYQDKYKKDMKEYREKNKEKIATRKHKYYQKNRNRILQHVTKYYNKNKERILESRKTPESMERNRIKCKKHRHKHKEKYLQKEREYRKTPEGQIAKKRGNAKRRRNLKFIPLFLNPFPEEIQVDYHHINNLLVIPLPTIFHNLVLGMGHKRKCNQIIEKLYGLNLRNIIAQ